MKRQIRKRRKPWTVERNDGMEVKRTAGTGMKVVQAAGSMVKKGGSGVKRAEQSVKGSLTSSVLTEEEEQETSRTEKGTAPGFSTRRIFRQQEWKAKNPKRGVHRPKPENVPESGTVGKAVRAGEKVAENTVATAGKAGVKGASASAAAAGGAATGGAATATAAVLAAAQKAKEALHRMKDAVVSSSEGGSTARHDNMADVTGWAAGKSSSGKDMGMVFLVALPMVLLPVLVVSLLLAVMGLSGGGLDAKEIVAVARREEAAENIGGIKYKTWYGIDGNWCAMFVSWCSDQCGYIESGVMPKAASVQGMLAWYRQRDQYREKESGYEPQAGDIVFFTKGRSHVGIVIAYDSSAKVLTTIEGNAGDSQTEPYHMGSRVKEKRYPITYGTITGYGTPRYPDDGEGDTGDPDIPVTVCRMKWLAVVGTEKNRKERQ